MTNVVKVFCLSLFALVLLRIPYANGQDFSHFFQDTDQLPTHLLEKRTVVFVQAPPSQWKDLAQKMHKQFVRVGIDAVAYYRLADIYSGHDAREAFFHDIEERQIDYLALIGQADSSTWLRILKIPEKPPYLQRDAQAYFMQNASVGKLGDQLYSLCFQQGLVRSNFLILEVPEFFDKTTISRGRKVMGFTPDLKLDKVAVPRMAYNMGDSATVDSTNAQMKRLMDEYYPFNWGFVDADVKEKDLPNMGYLFILRYLHNSGSSIKRMLSYEGIDNETLLISVRKGGPNKGVEKYQPDDVVYKYYLRQLYTGDMYLDSEWDAASSWPEALKNFVINLRVSILKK